MPKWSAYATSKLAAQRLIEYLDTGKELSSPLRYCPCCKLIHIFDI